MNFLLQTPRLLLREITLDDGPGMFALDSDPEVHKYLGGNTVKSLAESEEIIRHIRRQYEENGIGRWAVIDKASGDFIGWSGLKYEMNSRTGTRYYDLGYRLRQPYWGKGIATETAAEALKYGFGHMGLEEICAAAHIDNIASNTILRKLGFQWVETFEGHGSINNWYEIKRLDYSKS